MRSGINLSGLRMQLADALLALRRGDLTLDQFKAATSPDAVQRWLAATQLPGTLGAHSRTPDPDALYSARVTCGLAETSTSCRTSALLRCSVARSAALQQQLAVRT